MINLYILIAQTALAILAQQQVGGSGVVVSMELLKILAAAKAAYEKETGQSLDVSKIKPYEPV